jgi:hypothetical protein
MNTVGSVVAVYGDHNSAEAAVKKLIASGFETKNLSVVGKGYHTDEKVVGFYNTGDRVKFWGTRGAFWGGFWGLLLSSLLKKYPASL